MSFKLIFWRFILEHRLSISFANPSNQKRPKPPKLPNPKTSSVGSRIVLPDFAFSKASIEIKTIHTTSSEKSVATMNRGVFFNVFTLNTFYTP